MRQGSRSAGMMWEIPRKLGDSLPRSPPKLKLAPEVMNYFNEFTGVTRWRLVDYRGLSNLRICIKHECPCYRATARELPHARARAYVSIGITKNHRAED